MFRCQIVYEFAGEIAAKRGEILRKQCIGKFFISLLLWENKKKY